MPSSHYSFYDCWIVSKSNKEFERFIILISRLNIESISEIDSKNKISIKVIFIFDSNFCYFTIILCHSKYKKVFFMTAWAMAHNVLLDLLINWVIKYIFWRLFRAISLRGTYDTLLLSFNAVLSLWVGANITSLCLNSITWFIIFFSRNKMNLLYVIFLWACYLLMIFFLSEERLDFSDIKIVFIEIFTPLFIYFIF